MTLQDAHLILMMLRISARVERYGRCTESEAKTAGVRQERYGVVEKAFDGALADGLIRRRAAHPRGFHCTITAKGSRWMKNKDHYEAHCAVIENRRARKEIK